MRLLREDTLYHTKEAVSKDNMGVAVPVKYMGQAYHDTENKLFLITQRHEMVRDAHAKCQGLGYGY